MKFLSQHTKVYMPTVFSSCRHADLGHYIILEFIENTGLLSCAFAKPNEDIEEAPVLNTAIASCELEVHLYNVAVHLRHLFQPSFPAIGSLVQAPQGLFEVGGRPLTQNMYNMTYLANIPPSVLPAHAHDSVYHTADDGYAALAEMNMLQLAFQHNDLVKDEDNCRNKYVAQQLFLKLARAGKLSTFGFTDYRWSAQSKGRSARKSWAFDSIFWRYLDERFFGKRTHTSDIRKPHWRARIGLLSRAEKIAMEAFVVRKMKESQDKDLRTWDEQEARNRKADVLFNHDQCAGHGK